MKQMNRVWLRVRRSARNLCRDRRGSAATELAIIVPMMLVLFFGTIEFSSGVAVDRNVTLTARTLSDLTSQNISVTDAQLTNFFAAATGIMTPYPSTPTNAKISELYIDASLTVHVIWTATSGSNPP